ncbi:MAG: amidase family protein, partial [Actinomycetota bacterium]|nr:amidase family protein [Actinomycetota bacterium]
LSWFSALVNHAGNPAIVIPLTMATDPGLPPPSLQIIAPWWQEETLLGVAARLEQQGIAGFRPPPVGVRL